MRDNKTTLYIFRARCRFSVERHVKEVGVCQRNDFFRPRAREWSKYYDVNLQNGNYSKRTVSTEEKVHRFQY